MSKLVGYARVSTKDQDLRSQIDALIRNGCDESDIYTDVISGSKSNRVGLSKCLSVLKSGDILLVWRLDRLGRSMSHLVNLIEELGSKGISFKSNKTGVNEL